MSVVQAVCSEVAVMDGGRIAEQGAVDAVFANPKTQAAKELLYA
jgi:D-methionine transport system ATP-binding protein